jgi:hypothetical protein
MADTDLHFALPLTVGAPRSARESDCVENKYSEAISSPCISSILLEDASITSTADDDAATGMPCLFVYHCTC